MQRSEPAVGGLWLSTLTPVDAVSYTTQWGPGVACGPSEASFTLGVDRALDPTWLRPRSTVEVFSGDGVRRWGGRLQDVGRELPREVSARGLARMAADFDAVDSFGEPTTNPRTAVTQAIARGLPWSNPTVFPNTSLGTDGTPTVKRLDQVLNDNAVTSGYRWGVDNSGAAFWAQDPTTPTWFLNAQDLELGVADDGLYTRVRARYVSSVNGTTGEPDGWSTQVADDATAQGIYGVIEYPMDLTDLGLLSSGTALGYATQQLALLTVPQWLSRVAADGTVLLDQNAEPANVQKVRAGDMVRLFNVPNSLGGLRAELNLNIVIGEASWSAEDPTEVTIAPVNLAVRNLVDALTEAARASKKAA